MGSTSVPPNSVPQKARKKFRDAFAEFVELETMGGILLMASVVVAMVWANGPASASYFQLWATHMSVGFGDFEINKELIHWINDGLMAVFFLVVGLEIKRELLVGELASLKQAILPIAAAIGGMVIPAVIFYSITRGHPGSNGWGVPMATDIAFSLGVLALLGSRVPLALKVFLTALAIVDDLGAVLVIALFYTSKINMAALSSGLAIFGLLLLLNKFGIRRIVVYALFGVVMWVFFLKSGVHATIAGILLALAVPTRIRMNRADFTTQVREQLDEIESERPEEFMTDDEQDSVREIERACEGVQMPLEQLKHMLHPWQTYLIVPLFALANSGIVLKSETLGAISDPVPLGIMAGLVLGKPIGITFLSWIAVRANLAALPDGVSWKHIFGASVLAGIGFTMSLFISDLAFLGAPFHDAAKIGVFTASLIAAIVGYVLVANCSKSAATA